MTEQTTTKPEVVAWEPGESGIVTSYGNGWQGYSVGSRDEAYAELQRIEEEKRPYRHVRQ